MFMNQAQVTHFTFLSGSFGWLVTQHVFPVFQAPQENTLVESLPRSDMAIRNFSYAVDMKVFHFYVVYTAVKCIIYISFDHYTDPFYLGESIPPITDQEQTGA